MASSLPQNIEQLVKDTAKVTDPVLAFRAYVKLLDTAYKATEKLGAELRRQESSYQRMKTDHQFFARHRAKVDVLIRAMRETYVNSTKAMRTLEDLAQHYPAQYVFDVCQLGSYRLGNVQGWAFLNLRSASRLDADQNYLNAVLPAIAAVLPDHRGYVELRNAGIEEKLQHELDKLNEMRRTKAEIDSNLPKWTDGLKALASGMQAKELERLNPHEQAVNEKLKAGSGFKFANAG
ncbi:MAG: hypothetical protein NXI18_14080 [Alphaproteobacteria bacterium]|nr:hypothetical protein [Alphaproteobacteria bacterium]